MKNIVQMTVWTVCKYHIEEGKEGKIDKCHVVPCTGSWIRKKDTSEETSKTETRFTDEMNLDFIIALCLCKTLLLRKLDEGYTDTI